MQEADIDAAAFKEVGYTLDAFGQKTYNGVATILRDPLPSFRTKKFATSPVSKIRKAVS